MVYKILRVEQLKHIVYELKLHVGFYKRLLEGSDPKCNPKLCFFLKYLHSNFGENQLKTDFYGTHCLDAANQPNSICS